MTGKGITRYGWGVVLQPGEGGGIYFNREKGGMRYGYI